MDDVAAAAGLTKGAVYSNFTSKDELFLALMEHQVAERIAVAARLAADGDVADPVTAVATAVATMTAAQPQWHRLFMEYWSRALRVPEVGAAFAHHRRQIQDAVAAGLGRLRPDRTGGLSDDQLAVTVLALSNGLAVESLIDPERVSDGLLADVLARVMSA